MGLPSDADGTDRVLAGAGADEPLEAFERAVRSALEEDLGPGDVSAIAIPPGARARARLVAKAPGVLAGLAAFRRAFELCDPQVQCRFLAQDGEVVAAGAEVALVVGRAAGLLAAERTALNFLQRLSGVATLTRRFVDAVGGRARILDTRKTTPGLRALEKYAVRCGGGENHRFGLFDQAMLKENHLALAGSSPEHAVRQARATLGSAMLLHVEARDEDEALAAVRGGADVVLLDNMDPARISSLAPRLRAARSAAERPLRIEASGGVTLLNVAEFAASGVDRISVGALTHSAPALDLSLLMEPEA
jgi:nicotinate-nucleotide pyrophosphorylase (carboxylating)